MEHVCQYLRIFPGTEQEYDRRHISISPDLSTAIRESGIRNYTGFRRGTEVWYYAECEPDARTAFAICGATEASVRWNNSFETIVAEPRAGDREDMWYRRIFSCDGPLLEGQFERALSTLELHPDRIAQYDDRMANVWPAMLAAITFSGIRKYQCFRQGGQVVYYGEYYPDRRISMAKLGTTDINRNWNSSLDEIVIAPGVSVDDLTQVGEIFHQD